MNFERMSTLDVLMSTARLYATRSTCDRNRVGAVIARDGRIVASGYNGAPAGMPHCNHTCTCNWAQLSIDKPNHRDGCPAGSPCTRAVHGEANAIAFAARHGVATEGCTLYTTLSPCVPCSQLIINAGIVAVWFDRPYRIMDGVHLLKEAGVEVLT